MICRIFGQEILRRRSDLENHPGCLRGAFLAPGDRSDAEGQIIYRAAPDKPRSGPIRHLFSSPLFHDQNLARKNMPPRFNAYKNHLRNQVDPGQIELHQMVAGNKALLPRQIKHAAV